VKATLTPAPGKEQVGHHNQNYGHFGALLGSKWSLSKLLNGALVLSVTVGFLIRGPLYQTLPAREALASSSRVAILSGQSGTWRRKRPWAALRSAPA
jgi:hypothetical protein